ncbi:hypothetical protein [Flavobacterium ajazii]|uniref:hypothetical protein n=1 Tax=Flavobacterium ajazii TaxID=2692318 RepID=UPI0013D57A4F|nr:hypothetical protein [Flavobacterium ajazii]
MKKQILISLIVLGSGLNINAQWNGTNPVSTTSNVGIGTGYNGVGNIIPVEKLTIGEMGGNFAVQDRRTSTTEKYSSGYKFYDFVGESASVLLEHNAYFGNNARALKFLVNGDERVRINSNGSVGIGTSNPTAKLHVNNGDNSYGTILANATESAFSLYAKSLTTQPFAESFRLGLKYDYTETNGFISFYRGGSISGGFLGFSTNGQERIRISDVGNVGIGTANPDQKLTVNGTIHSKEVIVDTSIAPDYVFQKYYTGRSELKSDYAFPTLSEIEDFTKKNNHLPGVPSAKEMQEKGISLAEMSTILLQKIEELTLYTIEQQKELKRLRAENEQYKSLAERLAAIEKELKK